MTRVTDYFFLVPFGGGGATLRSFDRGRVFPYVPANSFPLLVFLSPFPMVSIVCATQFKKNLTDQEAKGDFYVGPKGVKTRQIIGSLLQTIKGRCGK